MLSKLGVRAFAFVIGLGWANAAELGNERFTIRGFQQGMSVDEAAIVAQSSHYLVKPSTFAGRNSFDIEMGATRIGTALFCDNQLQEFSYTLDGGFMNFLKLSNGMGNDGYDVIDSRVRILFAYDGSEVGELSFYLRKPRSAHYVRISYFASQSNPTNSAISYTADGLTDAVRKTCTAP